MSIVVDHITPRSQGGGDRLENLRVVHDACNVRRRREGWNRKVRTDDARGGNKKAYLNLTEVEEVRALHASGKTYREIAPLFNVSFGTIMSAVRGIHAYAAL